MKSESDQKSELPDKGNQKPLQNDTTVYFPGYSDIKDTYNLYMTKNKFDRYFYLTEILKGILVSK